MDTLQLDENVCRICLEHGVLLDWEEKMFDARSLNYKDCYYKYTELQESVSDPFSTNLCLMCAFELKNAKILFEKALRSFKILQAALNSRNHKSDQIHLTIDKVEMKHQMYSFDDGQSDQMPIIESPTDNIIEEIEKVALTDLDENDTLEITENEINNLNFTNSKHKTEKRTHSIDIQNYKPTEEHFIEQCFFESDETKLLKMLACKKSVKKRKACDSLGESSMKKVGEIRNATLEKSLEQDRSDNCDIKSSTPATANKAGKMRKKYILMCAYCSLKVDGTNQLKKHEATHSKDRKRTETCPICGIKLYTKLSLNNHMETHDENRQKKHKCEFCEKAFFNRGALNVHRRIHLGLMVTCRICSKEFYRQIDLDKHLLKHSASPVQKNVEQLKYNVQCQYCNAHVPTSKWKGHKAAHLNQPQLKCKICDKNFFVRSKCVRHLQQFHKKKKEYEEFIYYYANSNIRMSHLMIKQQEIVKPLTPTLAE